MNLRCTYCRYWHEIDINDLIDIEPCCADFHKMDHWDRIQNHIAHMFQQIKEIKNEYNDKYLMYDEQKKCWKMGSSV